MRTPGSKGRIALFLLSAATLGAQQAPSGMGEISGRVLDGDGRPMQQVDVSAIGPDGASMEAISEPDGYYRLYYLPVARYRVRAVPRAINLPPEIRTDGSAEVHYGTTYYPASLTLEEATPVDVQPSSERTEIDIRLVKIPIVAVRGVVSGIPAGVQYVGITVAKVQPRRAPNIGRGKGGYAKQVNPDGSFAIWGLDPGIYILTAGSNGAGWNSAPVEVEVKDKDVSGVAISLVGKIDISGQVVPGDDGARIPPSPPNGGLAQHPQIHLMGERYSVPAASSIVADDGSFHFPNVQPGKYAVTLMWGAYVQSMRLGATDIEGATLDLRNGFQGGALTVRASSATGQIGGVVTNPAGAVTRTIVELLSDENPGFDRGATTRADGAFNIANIRPGRYKLFVLDGGVTYPMAIRDQLADYADITVTVAVHPGERLTQDLRQHGPR